MRWLWYLIGVVVVLLILGWLLGWFGAEVADEAGEAGGAVVVEEPADVEAVEEVAD